MPTRKDASVAAARRRPEPQNGSSTVASGGTNLFTSDKANSSGTIAGYGCIRLSRVTALSGVAYRAFTEALEDNPGLTAEGWLKVAEANEAAKRCNPLLIAKSCKDRHKISMEQRFGGLADVTLLREGIVTDDDSRW
ncbi:hypothetical protein [Bradyrhizobium barranii]